MASTILEIRPHERKKYYEEWPGEMPGSLYAIAMIETLPLPCLEVQRRPESRSLALVCAAYYETSEGERPNEKLWGWIHLGPDAKEEIGEDLEKAKAEVGRWYYLLLSPESAE